MQKLDQVCLSGYLHQILEVDFSKTDIEFGFSMPKRSKSAIYMYFLGSGRPKTDFGHLFTVSGRLGSRRRQRVGSGVARVRPQAGAEARAGRSMAQARAPELGKVCTCHVTAQDWLGRANPGVTGGVAPRGVFCLAERILYTRCDDRRVDRTCTTWDTWRAPIGGRQPPRVHRAHGAVGNETRGAILLIRALDVEALDGRHVDSGAHSNFRAPESSPLTRNSGLLGFQL